MNKFVFSFSAYFIFIIALLFSCNSEKEEGIYERSKSNEITSLQHIKWLQAIQSNQKNISHALMAKIENLQPAALLIVQGSQIKAEHYWNEHHENTVYNAFEISQSVVSILIGIAIDEEKIQNIYQSITDFIPALNKHKSIKIIDLLNMNSGLKYDDKAELLELCKLQEFDEINDQLESTETLEYWEYEPINTILLACILEQATDLSLSQYASEKLWTPLGAEHSAYWSLQNNLEKADYGFAATTRDLARIAQLMLSAGKFDSRQIVSKNFIDSTFSPNLSLKTAEKQSVDFYGLHWWLMNYKGLTIRYAQGKYGQFLLLIPQKNAFLIRAGHSESESIENSYHSNDILLYLDAAFEVLD